MRTQNTLTSITIFIFALMMSPSAHGQRRWNAPAIVVTNCSGCHGIDGKAELSYFPSLAGLDASYAETRIAEFNESPAPSSIELYGWIRNLSRKKADSVDSTRNGLINMIGISHSAKPEELKQANLWYASQHPIPGRGGNETLIKKGQELYLNGVPDKNILPCSSCHGQDAQGDGKTPRLAGQNAQYTEAQMKRFRGGGVDKYASVMSTQARDVTDEQAHAIAVYLTSK